MKKAVIFLVILAVVGTGVTLFFLGNTGGRLPEPPRAGQISDNELDPEVWGKYYPIEYDSWLETKNERPAGKTVYKKGGDKGVGTVDKLSEFPYMALLFNGMGFGVEYNEPRGHHYMMTDQREIDQSRTKAGGACLACKTPYADRLVKETKGEIFKMSYADAVNKIPEKHRELGVACADCHDNSTMNLKLSKWTINEALKDINHQTLQRQELRSAVCAQCHVTYVIPKDSEMRSTGVIFPWKGSKWGDISIENIIKQLKSDPAYLEWKQAVTGFKMALIRHPEFEFFTRGSTHFNANVSCADCHMPYKLFGYVKASEHNVMSPLKNDMRPCIQCHTQSSDWLKDRVVKTQQRTIGLINRAGYATAVVAKLFEMANNEQLKGKTMEVALYDQAKEFYTEAFYRIVFLGAENSLGFHNPPEALRIAGDSVAFATKAEALLRQGLTKVGVEVPIHVNLELSKYINGRGAKKLNFKPELELKDDTGIQEMMFPDKMKGL